MFSRQRKWLQLFILVVFFVMLVYLYKYLNVSTESSGHVASLNARPQQVSLPRTGKVSSLIIKPRAGEKEIGKVKVNVNNLQHFQGLNINNELYVPFTFLETYYGIFGRFAQSDEFTWYHVNPVLIDLTVKTSKYTTTGGYLEFHTANVPKRARVKCICGRNEIPITTQWDPKGYYYPIQVAQYGLSYLSRYHLESKKRHQKNLKIVKGHGNVADIDDIPDNLFIIKLKFKDDHSPFQVKILASDGKNYILSYATDNSMITRKNNVITHGIGEKLELTDKVITRDLNVDILKGLSYQEGHRNGKTVHITILKIEQITLENPDGIADVKLVDIDYKSKFTAAANWFVKSQDNNGGWKVDVKRIIQQGMEAQPGWYSAMGQSQAISLLARVYLVTNDMKYLDAALKATKVFHKTSENGGVKADLFGLPWYEEYPTQPPSFVLNGFVYSLFGLYDLWKISGDEKGAEASQLFSDGFNTLEKRIALFDNGYNTFYDLRHLTLPGVSPNRARWQYHNVHLEQLQAMLSIRKSQVLSDVLKRWTGYVAGVLSRHN